VEVEGFATTVAAVQRWLPLGRDVLVRGDRGAGKTTVLEGLLADASRRGVTGLLLRSGGSRPFSALLDHASSSVRTPDPEAFAAWLAEELHARRSLLLVDDLDRVDDASLAVVRRVLGRTGSVLVASTTGDPLRPLGAGMRDLLVDRAPAEVHVEPFGFRAVAALLEAVLGAPADTALTSSVMAETGGNPGAVVALADAARVVGVLARQGGMWAEEGSLGDVPADVAAHVFLSGLGEGCVAALETLAAAGPVTADVAGRLVDAGTLAALVAHGRVVGHQLADAGEVLAVAPPLLARALRERVAPLRRRQLADRLAAEGGTVALRRTASDELTSVLLGTPSGEGGAPVWAAQVAGLVHERATAEERARRAQWRRQPTLATANDYLAALMQRPATGQVEEVLARVEPSASDDPAERAAFEFYRARWVSWAGPADVAATGAPDELGEGEGPVTSRDPAMAPIVALGEIKRRILRELADGRAAADVAADPLPAGPAFVPGWPAVMRAAALLDAGWPEAALAAVVRADAPEASSDARHYLAALRGQALLQAGRTTEAEQWERRMLDAAYDAVDALGIRVHAGVLAEVLFASAQPAAAWRVVSTALRLGAPGPTGTTFYRRGLTIGAVIQANAGNLGLAQVLVRELDRTPPGHRPLRTSMRPLAHAALAAAGGEPDEAAAIVRRGARRYAEQGLLQPALLLLTFGAGEPDAERARAVADLTGRTRVPLLDPYARLIAGVVAEDEGAVAAALPGTNPEAVPTLSHAADQLLGGPQRAGRPAGSPATRWGDSRPEPLSAREQEVAVLAREGLSNRQIADELALSVRTVENHMSRTLRKLRLVSRSELVEWSG